MHSKVFFTSDQHFGHQGIIDSCARPFADTAEMDRFMIEAWNSVIQPTDTVWFLGDFAHRCEPEYARKVFAKLNGEKRLIVGNHDALVTDFPWTSKYIMTTIHVDGQSSLFLCHYPMREWPGSHSGALHFFGHSHSRMPSSRNAIDVGVDNVGFVPQSLPQLRERMEALPELDFQGVEIEAPAQRYEL
jgi:calcineurin-like phosphoesterase family protein